jgi:hemolysin III
MMIFIMIAGSYTPVCLLVLDYHTGYRMLLAVWGIALGGIFIKALWITCPKWFSSILYISMGWLCISAIGTIIQTLSLAAFLWLLAGGLLYTIGGVIYALKLKVFNARHANFGSHEIFHLFIMAGSFCHFIFMYQYVI